MLLQTGYTEASVVAAYYYALTQRKLYNQTAHQTQRKGAFVVSTNASLGANNAFPIDFPLWCAVYDSLGQAGVLSCGATTNTNVDVGSAGDIPSLCPSPYLVVVTNTNRHDQKVGAGYSNIYVDLAAPGDDTFSTYPKGGYGNFSGTSGATPHVTGAVGLLYSDPDPALINAARQAPANTALVIKSALLNSVDKLPSLGGKTVSGGRLNIAAARAALYEQLERVDTAFAVVGVYPNPASESITIAFNLPPAQTYTYNIYTIVGQLIETRAVSLVGTVRTAKLDTSRYASGVYFVHYTDVAGKTVVRKFVINH